MKINQRVWHHNGKESFGKGTIRGLSDSGKTYDIEWDTHRVDRENNFQDITRSHVDVGNVYPI